MTLAEATAQLTAAITALEAARQGSWSVGEFQASPPSLTEAMQDVQRWQSIVNALNVTATGSRWAAVGRWKG